MINPQLRSALERVFGQSTISCENDPGSFSAPYIQSSLRRMAKKGRHYATVERWGETYYVNCPVCGDTKHRLGFSHLWNTCAKIKNASVYFSKTLNYCFNEQCDIRRYFDRIESNIDGTVEIKTTPKAFSAYIPEELELPAECLPIIHNDVPEYVVEYLLQRKFDLQELNDIFHIKFAPGGTVYPTSGEPYTAYEDKLVIPIIQKLKLVSYQLRTLDSANRRKYYNPAGIPKSHFLYNVDQAMEHADIVIVEGVTDVWRIGAQAVCLFGKSQSCAQRELMKTLWGYDGCCIVVLDSDADYDSLKLYKKLKYEKIFPRGVFQLCLENGDPADHKRNNLFELLEKAGAEGGWKSCGENK
jgi:hypothetical protein